LTETRLVVVRAFGAHARGDILSEADQTTKILMSEHAADVVRVGAAAAAGDASADAGIVGAKAERS